MDIKNKFIISLGARQQAGNIWQAIENAYSQPHRKYHTMSHLEYMFNRLEALVDYKKYTSFETFQTIIWHDFVYDMKENAEKRSAEMMEFALGSFITKDEIKKIKKYILATKNHKPVDKNSAYIIDADMAILADRFDYIEYAWKVCLEYLSVYSIREYTEGRIKFLKKMLKTFKFHTKEFKELEEYAFLNMEKEIRILES